MKKRFLSMLLVTVLAVSLIAGFALSASATPRVISVSKHRADYGTRLDRMAKCVEFHTEHFGL